jgi:diacylglycerol kinase (ATP)
LLGLIANPKAGNGKASEIISQFIKAFLKQKIEYILTYVSGNTESIIREFEENNIKNIIVFGGDGTLNSVAKNVLYKNMAILVVPCGSGNDFSKSNWNVSLDSLIKAIKENRFYYDYVDTGFIKQTGIHFFNSFGIGLAGKIAKNKEKFQNYKISTIKTLLLNYKTFKTRVEGVYEGKSISIHIGINQIEGHGIKIFTNAKNNDGLMDIVIFKNVPYFMTFFKLAKVFSAKHLNDSSVVYNQSPNFTIEIYEELEAHYDGETTKIEANKYEIVTMPKSLRLLKIIS